MSIVQYHASTERERAGSWLTFTLFEDKRRYLDILGHTWIRSWEDKRRSWIKPFQVSVWSFSNLAPVKRFATKGHFLSSHQRFCFSEINRLPLVALDHVLAEEETWKLNQMQPMIFVRGKSWAAFTWRIPLIDCSQATSLNDARIVIGFMPLRTLHFECFVLGPKFSLVIYNSINKSTELQE